MLVLVGLAGGYVVQRQINDRAFNGLEANQVAQDAQRVRIALEYELRLLFGYAATNSVWDNTYVDIEAGDQEAFVADFVPADLRTIQSIDGVLGVSASGELRAGGIASGDGYVEPPADLITPQRLGQLFDPAAAMGDGTCGVVGTATTPYLFCGFTVFHTDGSGPAAGGLVVLKELGTERLAELSKEINLSVARVAKVRPGLGDRRTMTGTLGASEVGTVLLGADRIALDIRIPTVNGSTVLLECIRDRPIHQAATDTAVKMFVLVCCVGIGMLGLVIWMVRRGVRNKVQPLRQTTEAIVASGDRSLRVGQTGQRGDIGALAVAINSMLDTMSEQDEVMQQQQQARERSLRATSAQQRLAEQQVRRRAQAIVDETSVVVIAELQAVVNQVEAVRAATGTIDARVRAADEVTRAVVAMTHQADEVVGALGESLHRVGGIANMISGVAAKTNLLALNATIEAVRAGDAGRSFSIVAREVKELASATARSTHEITSTVESLERDAKVITETLTRMASGIGGIDDATGAVSTMAGEQQVMVVELDRCVKDTIGRLENMANLADRLDRRAAARVAVSGNSTVKINGSDFVSRLMDISETGLRCQVDPEVPLVVDQRAEFIIPLDGEEVRLYAVAVRRSDGGPDGGTEVGMRFVEPTANVSAQIRDYVTSFIQATDQASAAGVADLENNA